MTERPVLFSGAMVRALLAGTKTQTRRVLKPQPDCFMPVTAQQWPMREIPWPADGRYDLGYQAARGDGKLFQVIVCPYGAPGDRLWVRESGWQRIGSSGSIDSYYFDATVDEAERDFIARHAFRFRRRPSIHMPRTACRIVLEVTAVRVERLQAISEEDAIAEGVSEHGAGPLRNLPPAALCYRELWDSLNAKRGFGWKANPWVWVVAFRRAEAPA